MSAFNRPNSIDPFSDVKPAALLDFVESLPPREIDTLPFGVIRLDGSGNVSFFSRTEAAQSGFGDRQAIGKKFFSEIAPCMGAVEFQRRLEQAQHAGTLDIAFDQVGDFDDAERELRVRMISDRAGGMWVFLKRPAMES